jgi:hypothetical protein
MDPISIGIALVACKVFFRRWARAAYKDALEDQLGSRQAYEYSLHKALEEQEKCTAGCKKLSENRKSVLDCRWGQLHTFLVACGINGGLFAPPRRVFGKRLEENVRSIISRSELLVVGNDNSLRSGLRVVTSSSVLVQGFLLLDSQGVIDVPMLHDSIHDVAVSLSTESGGALADTMGALSDLEVGDFLGGAFSVLSFAISGSIFASASKSTAKATQLREQAERLDDKRAILEAANQRIPILLAELDAASYLLFKWTVVGQEAARLKRANQGRKRNVSDLPRWILNGLLLRAAELWSSLEKSVFC